VRFLADENFDNDILRGVWRRIPDAQFDRVQDLIPEADDPTILSYAAEHGYIVLTHDVNTMRGFYYARITEGLPVPGLFLVIKETPIGAVIEELELILLASDESEWIGQIEYIPLR
jgi:hypothetical protein